MSDARDQINLAAWMERRMDAIGPYGPHVLDGVRRYEARIAHHDDVVRELVEALDDMADLFSADNALKRGTHLNATLCRARAALANIAQEDQR